MTRNTAEALLLANGIEGTYLMRRSKNKPGMYTVSVRFVAVKHLFVFFGKNFVVADEVVEVVKL